MELNEIITQKWSHKKNQMMNKVQIYPKIKGRDLSQGPYGQTDMKIILNVAFKKVSKYYHKTKVSVNC